MSELDAQARWLALMDQQTRAGVLSDQGTLLAYVIENGLQDTPIEDFEAFWKNKFVKGKKGDGEIVVSQKDQLSESEEYLAYQAAMKD